MAKKRERRRDRERRPLRRAERANERRGERRRARKERRTEHRRARKAAERRERRLRKAARRERRELLKAARRRERMDRKAAKRRARKARRATRREERRARRHEALLARRRAARIARAFGRSGVVRVAGMRRSRRPCLRGIGEIRAFLRDNTVPILFVAPTPFNLLGIDRWVGGFRYVANADCFDGGHPRVLVPRERAWREFHSLEEIAAHLLRDPDVAASIRAWGPGGRAAFLAVDDEVGRLAAGLGLETVHPPPDPGGVFAAAGPSAGTRRRTGTTGTRLGAIVAVVTRHGTIVGPLSTDLVGLPELTADPVAWCGDDMRAGVLSDDHRRRARRLVRRLGDALAADGYRGCFEVDVLADPYDGRVFLGAAEPRMGSVASLTNATSGAYADLPLFAFHLLEHLDVEYEVDVDDIDERWARAEPADAWSQLVLQELDDRVELVTDAPRTGIWRMAPDGTVGFDRRADDWHGLLDEDEAFLLRIVGPGDFRYRGVELGVLVARGRMGTDDRTLSDRGAAWVAGLRALWAGRPHRPGPEPGLGSSATPESPPTVSAPPEPAPPVN